MTLFLACLQVYSIPLSPQLQLLHHLPHPGQGFDILDPFLNSIHDAIMATYRHCDDAIMAKFNTDRYFVMLTIVTQQ